MFARNVTVGSLIFSLFATSLLAETHIVSPSELKSALQGVSSARQKNRDTIANMLSTPVARDALKSAHINQTQVTAAVASLNDEELARFADRAAKAQADVEAGRLTDRDLIIVLIGIAALILIIVAVR
jgi:hypothetical protein